MPKYPTPEYRGGKKAGAATSGLSKDAFLAPPAWAPTAPPPTLPPALAPLAPAAGGLPALGPVGIAVGVGIALGLWSSKGIKDFLAKQWENFFRKYIREDGVVHLNILSRTKDTTP